MQLSDLYRQHVAEMGRRTINALEHTGYEHLLIASGVETCSFLDDRSYPFRANPHFLSWAPLDHHPSSWIVVTPGNKPILIYFQPTDYWHAPPAAPSGDWTECFDVRVIREAAHAAAHFPQKLSNAAIIGDVSAALDGVVPNNPTPLLNRLHMARTRKTPYELALLRHASARGVRGHRAAEAAFRSGASEHQIHLAYCSATDHTDAQLPYENIVALNANSAVLHYHHTPGPSPEHLLSFLIDAGAQVSGYACDITRTYSAHSGAFAELIHAVDEKQRLLVDQMRAGTDYRDLHLNCHHYIGQVLHATGLVDMSPEGQVEREITSVFFPHGLGHFLGIQVHDVAGLQRDEDGGAIPRPPGHPFLRLTRRLEAGNVVTVEPGLYFIPMLLEKLRAGKDARCINWGAVDALSPYGGIRIEDDVLVTDSAPENLTRNAFAEA